ncbi:MAG: epoxyqueuosine reductase [bacterium]
MFTPELLQRLDIVDWGYTKDLEPLSYDKYMAWLKHEQHGSLAYLEGERADQRKNLKLVYPECKSALVFLFSYAEKKYALEQEQLGEAKIASYVTSFGGLDYHHVIKDHLNKITDHLKKTFPTLEAKPALDVLPVLERDLALRAGLGWFGKNSMMIHKREGSFTMIGALLLNQELEIDASSIEVDHCGQCTACADACPTLAIDLDTRTIKADLCVSTYTIETFKDAPAPAGYETMSEIFGCDICQDVCPWNKRWLRHRLTQGALKGFKWDGLERMREVFLSGSMTQVADKIKSMGVREFKRLFKGTALERTGRNGLLKNLLHKKDVSG